MKNHLCYCSVAFIKVRKCTPNNQEKHISHWENSREQQLKLTSSDAEMWRIKVNFGLAVTDIFDPFPLLLKALSDKMQNIICVAPKLQLEHTKAGNRLRLFKSCLQCLFFIVS